MSELLNKVKDLGTEIKTHWNTPFPNIFIIL